MAKKSMVIKLGKGWKELDLWAKAFQGRLDQALLAGTKKALQFAKASIVEKIESGEFEKNSELTLLVKRIQGANTTPLIGQKNSIIRGLSTEVESPVLGRVGLVANRKTKNGTDLADIGQLLHDGGTIRITEEMKKGFARFLGAILKGSKETLTKKTSGKTTMTIPARQFIRDVIEDSGFQQKVDLIYTQEIRRVVRF